MSGNLDKLFRLGAEMAKELLCLLREFYSSNPSSVQYLSCDDGNIQVFDPFEKRVQVSVPNSTDGFSKKQF
jgi:hypothetical protein